MSKEQYFDFEEDFHAQHDKKSSRRDKKVASEKDRSKYKKSNMDQKKKIEAALREDLPDLPKGQILAISPEGISVVSNQQIWLCQLKGSLKKEKNRAKNLIAVGDYVLFEPKDHFTGSIAHVLERKSFLSRADNLSRRKEQLIAVNIDQVIITCSVVFPAIKPYLVDRYIIAAQKGNMDPIIVVNKIDLIQHKTPGVDLVTFEVEKEMFDAFFKAYSALDIPVIAVSTQTAEGLDQLRSLMHGKTSVFSGQSGVGKSSLINAVTGSNLKTGDIVGKTNKGSHTTTSTQLVAVEGGGFCVDTPGIKSFGIWDLDESEVLAYYPEFFPFASSCKFPNCQHLTEPQCEVRIAVEKGLISELRFASYCALMASLSEEHRHR